MNAAPTNDLTQTEEQITGPNKFVLMSFLFFFLVIAGIAIGDLIGAMFR